MSILADHFEKVRRIKTSGFPTTPGMHIDVVGTLIGPFGDAIWDLAAWNFQTKLLGPNIVFSSDPEDSARMLKKAGRDLADIGVKEIQNKETVFTRVIAAQRQSDLPALRHAVNRAYSPYALELMIDDNPPFMKGINQSDLALTHWNPENGDMINFLLCREYEHLNPPMLTTHNHFQV